MTPADAGLLVLAGLGAGFINTLAGGGSALALPALEMVTASASIANGTNRIAILLQNVAGTHGFGETLDRPRAFRLAVPMLIGGVAGAWVATMLSPGSMRVALSVAVALVAVSAVVKPPRTAPLEGWTVDAGMLVCGFYAGFVQAGVGFLLLAVLAGGLRLDLVRANAIKVFIVLLATIPVLAIFALRGQVAWLPGIVLAAGNMSGAAIASRMAVKKGAAWVRWVVVGAAAFAIAKLLFFPAG
ncbi:MAG: sulfite exporter TauE/SafE family protein [Planctomycetota bacterium]